METLEHLWMRRVKWLTQALIISVTLNIGLLAAFITFILKEKQQAVPIEFKTKKEMVFDLPVTNEQLVRAYSLLSFQELVLRLENKELVEEGYAKRDLALACLTSFHHFDVERATGGAKLQERRIVFASEEGKEKIEIPLFLGLADYQYEGIIRYLKTERWPLTSQGLFFEIVRTVSPRDTSLLEAFYLTPEFYAASTLFSKSGLALERETVVQILAEGDWNILKELTEGQKQLLDFSISRRRTFLIDLINKRSKMAAKILLESDLEFALKWLDDGQILNVFDHLGQERACLAPFAKGLLIRARSDAVWKKAAEFLYKEAKEPLPEPYDHRVVLARFASEMPPEVPMEASMAFSSALPSGEKAPILVEKPLPIHVIQEGDSLWKIAKKYHVTVEAIMLQNGLESERLRVGKKLEIPLKEADPSHQDAKDGISKASSGSAKASAKSQSGAKPQGHNPSRSDKNGSTAPKKGSKSADKGGLRK